jgi:hypothetical protein
MRRRRNFSPENQTEMRLPGNRMLLPDYPFRILSCTRLLLLFLSKGIQDGITGTAVPAFFRSSASSFHL